MLRKSKKVVKIMGRIKKYIISLTNEERQLLETMVAENKSCSTVLKRCRILLDLDANHGNVLTYEQCAYSNGICKATVENIARKFCEVGLEKTITLERNERSNTARKKLDRNAEEKLVQTARGPAPEGHSRWTLSLLEEYAKKELDISVKKDAIRSALKRNAFVS